MNLEQKIKEKIDNLKIEPKSKWSFVFKEWFIWFLGILSIIVGSLIVSATLFYLRNVHWGLYSVTHENFFDFLLEFLPFVWFVLFVGFAFLTFVFLRKTKKGYKYNFFFIISAVFIASIFLGVLAYNRGLGYVIENKIGSRVPFYKNIELRERTLWGDGEKGFYLGVITKQDDYFYLKTERDLFLLNTVDLPDDFESFFDLDEDGDDSVRVVGKITEDGSLYPCMIFPFEIVEKEFFGGKELKIKNEINPSEMRINNCRGVRPYAKIIIN